MRKLLIGFAGIFLAGIVPMFVVPPHYMVAGPTALIVMGVAFTFICLVVGVFGLFCVAAYYLMNLVNRKAAREHRDTAHSSWRRDDYKD